MDAPLDNDSFPFSTARTIKVAGHDVLALRLTFIGEMGYVVQSNDIES